MPREELSIMEIVDAERYHGVVDPCVWCGRSTAFGSGEGLFVNRVGADREELNGDGETIGYLDGWACPECAGYDCAECNEPIYVDCEVRVIDEHGGNTFYHEECHNEAKHGKEYKWEDE